MQTRLAAIISLAVTFVICLPAHAAYNPQRMGISHVYPTNYDDWANAFLSGNGKMGIMVFGDPLHETVIYNDRGFNMAKTGDRSFAQVSVADLATIREDCAEGKFAAANALAVSSAHYQGGGEGNRHPGYEMSISIPDDGPVSNYVRTCNFKTGEIDVKWTDNRGDWERRAFVSRKDNVTVQYLTAPTHGKITCSIQLDADHKMGFPSDMKFDSLATSGYLNLRAKYGTNTGDAGYEGVTRYVVSGGTQHLDGSVLNVENADSVIMLTRTAKYYGDCETQWNRQAIQRQLAVIPADYKKLLAGQIATHQAIYDRVHIDLGASAADRSKSNEELLAEQKTSPVAIKTLWERFFDAGRYYYLSSSSELTPPDLLGIWTGNCNAGWGGFFHLDANLNLQVAGGNIGDMPEAMEGYFHLNELWKSDFETNARKLLGCRGMDAAGNTPGTTSGLMAGISDFYPYQYATGEEGWLLYPFWEHYLVTGDKKFLRDRLYPLLKDMGYFYEDFLTKTDSNGKYILAGSVSPENQPSNLPVSLLNNSNFDISGAKFCLSTLLQTCKILGADKGQDFDKWTELLNKLPPYLINSDGALQEWSWPGLSDNYNHRHSSHMLPVWPYREINPEADPRLFNAAKVTLDKKDQYDYGTGHGYLHSALIAAALGNDEAVNKKLLWLSRNGFYFDSLASSHNPRHDIFCTDVCNTVPAVMMEMLISSRPGVLELLPAVPQTLTEGAISGVKGRNRVTIQELHWNLNKEVVSCTLKSDIDQDITLIERGGIKTISTKAKTAASPLGQIARIVHLKAGESINIGMTLGELQSHSPTVSAPSSRPPRPPAGFEWGGPFASTQSFHLLALGQEAATLRDRERALPSGGEGVGLKRWALTSNWQLQDSAKVSQSGSILSSSSYKPAGWYAATVPGTVLTSLVNDGVYPEPLYGENNRPDKIPESLCRTPYWYRTQFTVPKSYANHRIWLNFDGINYTAQVWVNGKDIGPIKGAFTRGIFDISSAVIPGKVAALAVLVSPQPHPGVPHEHTLGRGMGPNGGVTAIDGPTFLCSIGWDWIPAIRDRDTGIWQKVYLSATGPVVVKDPLVTTDLPLPSVSTADIGIQATVQNVTGQPQTGILKGRFGDISFQQPVTIPASTSKVVALDSKTVPALHLRNPKLWWPNGYGPQNLYTLHLSFEMNGSVSDQQDVTFGVRKITYTVPDSENLTVSVNGVRVMCKGGDWGMDEAMKRIPRERLEAEIRMHALANYTIIRNWVGQSTSEDFYDLCDKYGIMLWDEFFQPNPGDGPNATDLPVYLANVREKILRFRNHPSIAIWCARNEGYPPKEIDDGLRTLMAELEPMRLYQPSSTAGHGVNSGGPYSWRKPRDFYGFGEAFKTEIGSVSIPTLESIHGMMPQKDWESINDDWAEHDFAAGASGSDHYKQEMEDRYGKIANLADFVRKGQMANYEAFRAMYEGRNAKLFNPSTGVITWMSNPAQPSFVWQLYHHDLEPNASLFAVRKACEPVHIQLNESNGHVEVINNHPDQLTAHAHIAVYNLDGKIAYQHNYDVIAAPSKATDLGVVEWPATLSSVHFVKLNLYDTNGKLLSDNFYWRALPDHPDNLQDLDKLPVVKLDIQSVRRHLSGRLLMDVTLHNPASTVALMTHLQLRRNDKAQERILPVYYSDNYVSLVPGETRTITVEAALSDIKGSASLLVVDGWNIDVMPVMANYSASILRNVDAQVDHWPVTGLPIYQNPPTDHVRIDTGGDGAGAFEGDTDFTGGQTHPVTDHIDTNTPMAGPESIYQTERWGESRYTFRMKPLPAGHTYTVRLHFAETTFDAVGKRKFNVDINGKQVLTDFDPYQEAGGKYRAVVRDFKGIVPDKDGNIQIHFYNGSADQPEINAIEIGNLTLRAL